jgi:hypothetical protein
MAGEGTLGAIKAEMDECSRLVDRARFEWALRHYDHARDAVAEARDGLISFLHCLTTPQFADYELDHFRWQAGQLDRAITAIEESLAALLHPRASAAAAD